MSRRSGIAFHPGDKNAWNSRALHALSAPATNARRCRTRFSKFLGQNAAGMARWGQLPTKVHVQRRGSTPKPFLEPWRRSRRSPHRFATFAATMMTRLAMLFLPMCAASTAVAEAQRLFVVTRAPSAVMEFDATTGALIDPVLIDLHALAPGVAGAPHELIEAPNGELWVSDASVSALYRFSADGSTYLGLIGAGLRETRGLAPYGTGVLVANTGTPTSSSSAGIALAEIDASGALASATPIGTPHDVEPFVMAGTRGFLVTDTENDDIVFVDGADLTAQTVFHESTGAGGIASPTQVHVGVSGNVFVAGNSTPRGLFVYDAAGQQQLQVLIHSSLGAPRGIAELLNGNIFFTTTSGVYTFDPDSSIVTPVATGVSPQYASMIGPLGPEFGDAYCGAAPNSTGLPGTLTVHGSTGIAANNVTLAASGLPVGQFGYFLVGQTQGSFNPPGSQGFLCLSGNIGRYSQASQVIQGPSGDLNVDLAAIPVNPAQAAMAGETWNFQCWYRDNNPGPTSNFTNGARVIFE